MFRSFLLVLSTAPIFFSSGEVVISEISGASSGRLLKEDEFGQASLGPGVPWFQTDFRDDDWTTGRGPFGFGVGELATDLSPDLPGRAPSLYLRRSFQVTADQAASTERLLLESEYDDGLIVWINGREVARCHMGPPGMFLYSDQKAFNAGSTVGNPEVLALGRADELLSEGENVIAVQVANHLLSSPLYFDGVLRIEGDPTVVRVVAEAFAGANGAVRVHANSDGRVTNTTIGNPVPGGWLDRSAEVISGPGWDNLEVRIEAVVNGGEDGVGAVTYRVTGDGEAAGVLIPFPEVSMDGHWVLGELTAASLAQTSVAFRFQNDWETAFDFVVQSPDGAVTASGFPVVRLAGEDTVGHWRFEDEGARVGAVIAMAEDASGSGHAAVSSGSGGARYARDVPGPLIFDPLANRSWDNQFSMDASGAGQRLRVAHSPDFDTSFTAEMFIKIDGEPSGYTQFLRRRASEFSRWQIDFDHASSGAFGRLRARLDTPDRRNTNFVVGPQGGRAIPNEQRIWIDTDAGDGRVTSYNDPSDWSRDGNGRNDVPGWHHVAFSIDETTGEVKFYYDYELIQTRTLSGVEQAGLVHPSTFIEFGKFGSASGLLIDEIRYTGKVLEASQFLQIVATEPDVWATYEVDLGQADLADREALAAYLNAGGLTSFRPALRVREESFSPEGRSLTLDAWKVDHREDLFGNTLVSGDAEWNYHPGTAEPSGGVYEPNVPGVTRADFVDWIELENSGGVAVDLSGWSLSDDPADLRRWSFPEGTSIPAGGHLLVLADALDPVGFAPKFRHANFKLSREGEYLALVDRTGEVRAEFADGFPPQLNFYSFGRRPGGHDFVYLAEPTPGAPNRGAFFAGQAARPDLSVPGGFHDEAVTLSLGPATPGATIRYTTDGSKPTGGHGLVYQGALRLPRLDSRTGHIIRARAFADGLIPSPVSSATYLIGQSESITSAPALVLSGDSGRSFTSPNGIFTIEGGRYVDGFWEAVEKSDYNMALERGRAFERPGFVEYYPANGTTGFRAGVGFRVASSNFARPRLILDDIENSPWTSSPREKPSMNLYFRNDYGAESVTFPIFGEDDPIRTFAQLRARAGKNDMSNPHIKDELVRRLYLAMGQVGSRGVFNSLYVNGEWKGFYNLCERLREPFFQARYPGSGEWDILQAGNPNRDLAEGDHEAWDELNARLQAREVNDEASWEAALELVDPVAMADYFLLNIYTATWDWPHNNWVAARERSPEGRYRFYPWDAEGAFGHPWNSRNRNSYKPKSHNVITRDLLPGTNSTAVMFRGLVRWPEFRLLLADRIHAHFFLGGVLDDSDPANSRIKAMMDQAIAEFSPLLEEGFSETVDTEFWRNWTAPEASRRSYLLGPNDEHFRDAGYWPETEPPAFSRHGGEVPDGYSLSISGGPGTIYYTLDGSDPRRFGGEVAAGASIYAKALTLPREVVTVKARLRDPTGEWSALTTATFTVGLAAPGPENLVISEIHYHPGGPSAREQAAGHREEDDFEFIQLRNIGTETLDLSGLAFTDGIAFSFADGLVSALEPGASVLVVSRLEAFRFRYGSDFDDLITGQYLLSLSNRGEQIRLEGPGRVIRDFRYHDSPPWPAASDGAGMSLVLRHPEGNPDHGLAESWEPSALPGGLPGGIPRAMTYAEWAEALFAGAGAEGAGPVEDPDHDGLPNLLEFSLGSLPGVRDASRHAPKTLIIQSDGESYQAFRFREATGRVGLRMQLERSDDLLAWYSLDDLVEEILPSQPHANGSITRTFRLLAPLAATPHSYLRLRVTAD